MSKEVSHCNSKDVIYFFLLNGCSGFLLSAAHNVLHFVLDIHTPVIHFLHYLSTFIFMLLLRVIGAIPRTQFDLQALTFPVVCRLVETLLSSIVHSQNRTGSLYLIRVFDFVFTATLVFAGGVFINSEPRPKPRLVVCSIQLWLGFAVSLAWCELGNIEYTSWGLVCAPLLSISRALSLLSLQRSYLQTSQGHLEHFVLFYSGLLSASLFLPAAISYFCSNVEVDASWESIDYTLMGLSFLFMACYVYSDLWLALRLPYTFYATLDHTKFLAASCGQWIIQNMAHPSIIALAGKIFDFEHSARAVVLTRITCTRIHRLDHSQLATNTFHKWAENDNGSGKYSVNV